MVSCFRVIRSAIPTIFHGKIVVGDIQVGDIYICERVCKFVCYGSRRSYFFARNFLFFFLFIASINWRYRISSASYDVNI